MNEKILELKNWSQVANDWTGIYRYVIGAKVAYEIFVECHYILQDYGQQKMVNLCSKESYWVNHYQFKSYCKLHMKTIKIIHNF